MIKITECPRDALQGIHTFIPTSQKIEYINALLQVGFDVIDIGSFVSPKHVPQMRDSKDVIEGISMENTNTKLLAIVANERGAIEASNMKRLTYIGFPFSISEVFQKKNTNTSISESFKTLENIAKICNTQNKTLLVYISMAFGNPYGEKWNTDLVTYWVNRIFSEIGVTHFNLSDTMGTSNMNNIRDVFNIIQCQKNMNTLSIGAHFHSIPSDSFAKLNIAYSSGCKIFDVALMGMGGCPMADNPLVGNIDTITLLHFLNDKHIKHYINQKKIDICRKILKNMVDC